MSTESPVQKNEKGHTHIRWMICRDMSEVLAIENESSEFPWKEEDLIRCLKQRNCVGMVVDYDDHVAGFMFYELNRESINVLKFAVKKGYRQLGIGTAMINKLFQKLSPDRRARITIGAISSSQPFFEKYKFSKTDILVLSRPPSDSQAIKDKRFFVTMTAPEDKPQINEVFPECFPENEEGSCFEKELCGAIAFVSGPKVVSIFDRVLEAVEKISAESGQSDKLAGTVKYIERKKELEMSSTGTVAGLILTTQIEDVSQAMIRDMLITPAWQKDADLLKKMILHEIVSNCGHLFAEVKKEDLPLFESLGFKQIGQVMEYTFNENTPRPAE